MNCLQRIPIFSFLLVFISTSVPAQITHLKNISTNGFVDEQGMIAGFIVEGEPIDVVIMGENIEGLTNPMLTLTDINQVLLNQNDNWQDHSSAAQVVASLRSPNSVLDAAFAMTLAPGQYLAFLAGVNGGTGRGIVSITNVSNESNIGYLRNISTNGLVDQELLGDLVAGFIVDGPEPRRFVVMGENMGELFTPRLRITDTNFLDSRITERKVYAVLDEPWTGHSTAGEVVMTLRRPRSDNDAALAITLKPGSFLAHLTGGTGRGLISITETGEAVPTRPSAFIETPTGIVVSPGESLIFAGNAADPDGDDALLSYQWTFDGVAPATTLQNPGAIRFDTEGEFLVIFKATDVDGLEGEDNRSITVTTFPGRMSPQANIDEPIGNVTISPGQRVEFAGSGLDPDDDSTLRFDWQFQGGNPANSSLEDPGFVQFDALGTFVVSFNVTDNTNLSAADSRIVRVRDPSIASEPITAVINLPETETVFVEQGKTVVFAGTGIDTGNLQLLFEWLFKGGIPRRSTLANPGNVKFPNPGTFVATFQIADLSNGLSALLRRTVIVRPNGAGN